MIPPLPNGSRIEAERQGAGFLLKFNTTRSMHVVRWVIVAFLTFWLCGWAVGEGFAIWALFFSGTPWPVKLFLLFWLTLWTFGGLAAARFAFGLAQKPRLETLLIEPHQLTWTPPYRWLAVQQKGAGALKQLFGSRKLRDDFLILPRSEIASITLERTDNDSLNQKLIVRHGDAISMFGTTARQDELRWLHGVLNSWLNSRG
jgi:hypothetical protein